MIKITLDDRQVQAQLGRIVRQLKNPKPLYGVLGETLRKIHRKRFDEEVAPDGTPWQPLSPLTQAEKRGQGILKEDGNLRNLLAYNHSNTKLEFGSPMVYARLHQFGGTVKPKNRKMLRTKGGHFLRQAVIPARPWLGVNDNDKAFLLRKATRFLQQQLENSSS